MSITTMLHDANYFKAGTLVMARSRDLETWEIGDIFYSPGNHGYPECSDIFRMGDHWYLVASVLDKTCYRIGETPLGPWRAGRTDSFDGVLNYAAKTLGEGMERYFLGWIRTKNGCRDGGHWEWAGYLSFPRQLVQASDGTLYAKLPEQFSAIRGPVEFDLAAGTEVATLHGAIPKSGDGLRFAPGQLFAEIGFPGTHRRFDAELTFLPDDDTRTFGLLFCANVMERTSYAEIPAHPGYEVALDLRRNMLVFRKHAKRFATYTHQEVRLEPGKPVRLRVIVEEGIVEAFVNDQFALSSTFYHESPETRLGFFVEEGGGCLQAARIWALREAPAVTRSHAKRGTVGAAV